MVHQTKNNNNNDNTNPSHHHKKNDKELISSFIAAFSLFPVPSSSSVSSSSSHQLTPLEVWCTSQMEEWYSQSLLIKCPFFRRRMADLLDQLDMVMRFLIIRHKSLDIIGPPPGCRGATTVSSSSSSSSSKSNSNSKQRIILPKLVGMTPHQTLELIRHDWMGGSEKQQQQQQAAGEQQQRLRRRLHCGYYITGRLNTAIYRDDCWFDGPDPDMPVRGVRKYINAASHLFDHKMSTAELLDLQLGSSSTGERHSSPTATTTATATATTTTTTIVATWRLSGVLHLPWKPKLPTWTGTTTYHLDQDGALSVVVVLLLLLLVDWWLSWPTDMCGCVFLCVCMCVCSHSNDSPSFVDDHLLSTRSFRFVSLHFFVYRFDLSSQGNMGYSSDSSLCGNSLAGSGTIGIWNINKPNNYYHHHGNDNGSNNNYYTGTRLIGAVLLAVVLLAVVVEVVVVVVLFA
jgi:hypothetical protein